MPKRPALILSALFDRARRRVLRIRRGQRGDPAVESLAEFPKSIGEWRMVREGVIEQDVKDVLRADDYLTRQYAAPGKAVNLFVAFFDPNAPGRRRILQELPAGIGLDVDGFRHHSAWTIAGRARRSKSTATLFQKAPMSRRAMNTLLSSIGINRAIG